MADTAAAGGRRVLEIGDELDGERVTFERARGRDIAELVPAYLTNVGAYQGCRRDPRRRETILTCSENDDEMAQERNTYVLRQKAKASAHRR